MAMPISRLILLIPFVMAATASCERQAFRTDGRAYYIESADGARTLRVAWYGDTMVRLQTVHGNERWLPDDHYEMVQTHDWTSDIDSSATDEHFVMRSSLLEVAVDRDTLAARFILRGEATPVLQEQAGAQREGDIRIVRFETDDSERFTGLGHGYFARVDSLELTGTVVERNYGSVPIEQAPLIVPFYLSSLGYGVFLNSTFPNRFAMNADGDYSMAVDTHGFDGQMDYFFIGGPALKDVLDRYTQLTGRPRLPMKAIFGLQLSDKGHDHNSETPSDQQWWEDKITEHRDAGLPLDHVVNDNRWRAAGGKRCESKIEWDPERYPDPAAWKRWLDEQGLVSTLDFNRCIARFSEGWDPSFNLPPIDNIEFADSAPDLTSDGFRDWFWQIFYEKSLDPALAYPGDALWIDEFDEQGAAPMDIVLVNGRSSAEMRNYWFFLIAKALVADGWDKSDIERRPFVWVRGMTAGAQRYATLWSGDIKPNDEDMAAQVRAMQMAGLAGFPYWGHDAGGFFDWDRRVGPDESLYQRWTLAFGSFAPIWKPHGMGASRWPVDRSDSSLARAIEFARLRYELMPYLYTAAHEAAETGLPIARPMLLEFPDIDEAWEHDLQYFFGPDLLVVPPVDNADGRAWLPAGHWYSLWDGRHYEGDQVVNLRGETVVMPVMVRGGAIIPRREYAKSTAFIDKTKLIVDVYSGANGAFRLIEDDDRTEAYRNGERRITWLRYDDVERVLTIEAANGDYAGAPAFRDVTITLFEPGGRKQVATRRIPVNRPERIPLKNP
ncbi:MAG: glycoside hydrolase family 31 protein [Woeseiaceae bacterium]|nr:glycoside hydrolase family 31 protein [Woeseiaceae bacterium]